MKKLLSVTKGNTDVRSFGIGIFLIMMASLNGCTSVGTPSHSSGATAEQPYKAYWNIKNRSSYGYEYYLVKTDGVWKASKSGDVTNEDVERVAVVPEQHKIILVVDGDGRDAQNYCNLSVTDTRKKDGYLLCNSAFTSVGGVQTGFNVLTSPFQAVISATSAKRSFQATNGFTIDEELLEVANSSGLLAMVERDRQEKLAETAKREQDAADSRQRKEQEQLAADQKAEQGDAKAKYQRGMDYLGYASWNADAQKWFEKAAAAGSADAIFKLGAFQKDHYKNESEAEQLWIKAAHGGSIPAKNALNDLATERKRKAEQLAREREQQSRKLAQTKEIGQQVCASFSGTEKRVIGTAYGSQPIYGPAEARKYQVRGFTEGSNGNKIQIRIGGIQSYDTRGNFLGNTDRVDGETVFQNGAVIWDEVGNWTPC